VRADAAQICCMRKRVALCSLLLLCSGSVSSFVGWAGWENEEVHCVPLSHLCTLLLLPPPVRRATHAGVGGGEDRVWASERRRDETSSVRLRSVVSPGLTLGPSVDSRRSTCASVIFSWLHQATVTGAIDSPARLNIGLYEY
jgi:hypothetical protein